MKKVKTLIFSCLFLSLTGLLFQSANSALIPWLYKINFYYRTHTTPYTKGLLDTLSQSDLDFIQQHANAATAHLKEGSSEFEVAGAINDYIYQLLILSNNTGNPLKVLRDEYAICGGHALAMSALLEQVGINNRLAYITDVPYQGAHSMVQVTFKNGQEALYDPTFGLYWYDAKSKKPLSIKDLKQNPEWAATKILQTTHKKRTEGSQEIHPFSSITDHYASYVDEHIHHKEMFETYSNAGVNGYEFKTYKTLHIDSFPTLLGSHNLKNSSEAVLSLSLSKDKEGCYQTWLHTLGKQPYGENVSHVYAFDDLEPGKTYHVSLSYVKSVESVISATVVGGKFENDSSQTKHYTIENFGPKLTQLIPADLAPKSRTVDIPFIASEEKPVLILSSEGEMLFHAIEFSRA